MAAPNASSIPELSLQLLGRFAVLAGGRALTDHEVGTRKTRLLLKVLGVRAPAAVTAGELIEVLWPVAPPDRPTENLATLVSRARSVLGPQVVRGDRSGWALGERITTDLGRVRSLVAEADRRLAAGEPALSLTAAAAALGLLGEGLVLAEEVGGEWLDPVRAEVVVLLRQARHAGALSAIDAGDPAAAALQAERAIADDPLDEAAVRLAMRAFAAAGEPARGLAVYEQLRVTLAAELGADPAPETRAVHLALLTESPVPAVPGPSAGGPPERRRPRQAPKRSVGATGLGAFVGRRAELALLGQAWADAAAGRSGLLLVVGEPGIGKSRLAGELVVGVRDSGGLVLEARCYEAERSLFLQPFLDAIRPEVLHSSAQVLRELCGDRAPTMAALLPEVADVLGPLPRDPATPDTERRLAYDALTGFLRRLAARSPVLLVLDDAQNASLATVELVHQLARRASGSALLTIATVRSDSGSAVLEALGPVATRVDLGPLDEESVLSLATAAGRRDDGPRLSARTRGHPLFVVESLRALASGEEGLPASLAATVDQRAREAGPDLEQLVRTASALGTTFDPRTLAELLSSDELSVAQDCSRLAAAGLLSPAGSTYEFVNDLVQEILYAGTEAPLRMAYHRRAADVFADRPEASAAHAEAAQMWDRAGRAWLQAAAQAIARYAVADGESLASRGVLAAAQAADPHLMADAFLARARVRLTLTRYSDSLADCESALALAQQHHLAETEVLVQRELAGDVLVGLGRPVSACEPHVGAGLRLARGLGDRTREADFLARSAILNTSRLRFVRAIEDGASAVALARPLGDPGALIVALDGLKSAYAYLGDLAGLVGVVDELVPLCQSQSNAYYLQWCLLERSFVPLAAADWAGATAAVEEALALNRRSGWSSFESWFLAHLGWIARLAGRLDDAVAHGRRAVHPDASAAHPWWDATACAMLAGTLTSSGPGHEREAARLFRRGLAAADRTGAEGFRLRCLAGLAEVTGSVEARDQAQLMLGDIQLPPGTAWVHGADAQLALARAWLAAGRPETALAVLEPLHRGGTTAGWAPFLAACGVDDLLGETRAATGQTRSTSRSATRSAAPGVTGR